MSKMPKAITYTDLAYPLSSSAAVKAHAARVAAHPLPFALDEPARQVLAKIRRAYNYYQHMEPRASRARLIPD
jgi:hypothetical protein